MPVSFDVKAEVKVPDPLALIANSNGNSIPAPNNVSLPPQETAQQLDVNNLLREVTAKANADIPTSSSDVLVQAATDLKTTTEKPVEQPQEAPKETLDGILESATAKKGPAESLKALRQKADSYKSLLEAREAEILEREERLKKYETGEILPESVKNKLDRVSQLEQYEKLHALKTTTEYQEQYIQPIEDLKQKAAGIAADYGLSVGVIEKAYHIVNQKEQNAFLMKHFDTIGATEVKNLIEDMRDATNAKERAELEPQQALQRILEEKQNAEAFSTAQRLSTIERNANSGWVESITELTSGGDYPELTYTGNTEHDNTYVKPVLEEAAKEYGKFVKSLAALGARELPAELAKIVAKRFLLSQASSVMSASRAHHYNRAEEVISSARRSSPLLRPQIGGGMPSTPQTSNRTGAGGLEAAADALLRKVGVA